MMMDGIIKRGHLVDSERTALLDVAPLIDSPWSL